MPPLVRWIGAILLGIGGPMFRTLSISIAPGPVIVLGLGVLALVVAFRLHDHRRRALVVAVAAVCCIPSGGVWVGVWTLFSLPLALWVALDRPPVPSLRPARAASLPVVAILSLVAAWQGREVLNRYLPVGLTIVALIITHAEASRPGRIASVRRRIGLTLARAATTVLFILLGVVVVVAPWSFNSLIVADPLDPPKVKGTGWIPLRRAQTLSDRPWARPAQAVGPPVWRRIRRSVGGLVVTAALLVAAIVIARPDKPRVARLDARPAAFASSPWWDEYLRNAEWAFFDPGAAYNPLRYPAMQDLRSPGLNIEGGERRTWRPPDCAARCRVTVWVYGASTIFGLGQRDDHTIPSELARLAWFDGIPVEVRNRGVLGDLHWEEAQRFEWDLRLEHPPDLVIFYSGSNDVVGTQFREEQEGLDGTPVDWTAESAWEFFRTQPDPFGIFGRLFAPRPPEGVELPDRSRAAALDPTEMGTYVVEQYSKAREISEAAADDSGVLAHWFWQPTQYTRPPVEGEPRAPEEQDRRQRAVFRSAAAGLPDAVRDLSDVFSRTYEPLYFDDVHTNELGARLVAEAMYAEIRNDLARLSKS